PILSCACTYHRLARRFSPITSTRRRCARDRDPHDEPPSLPFVSRNQGLAQRRLRLSRERIHRVYRERRRISAPRTRAAILWNAEHAGLRTRTAIPGVRTRPVPQRRTLLPHDGGAYPPPLAFLRRCTRRSLRRRPRSISLHRARGRNHMVPGR